MSDQFFIEEGRIYDQHPSLGIDWMVVGDGPSARTALVMYFQEGITDDEWVALARRRVDMLSQVAMVARGETAAFVWDEPVLLLGTDGQTRVAGYDGGLQRAD